MRPPAPGLGWLAPLLVVFYATFVGGDTLIDDGSGNVQYSSGTIAWDHKDPTITNNSANVTKCYDQTYTVNHNLCGTAEKCSFAIPFTGSGITLYVIQSPDPINASVSVDSQTPTYATITPLTQNSVFQYNVSLYDLQGLTPGDHSLNVTLMDYVYSNGTTYPSMMRFDYARINETQSSSPSVSGTASSPSGTASSTPNNSGNSHSVIAPAVGGAVGGVVAIAVLVLLFVFCRRRRKQGTASTEKFDLTQGQHMTSHPLGNNSGTLAANHHPYNYTPVPSSSTPPHTAGIYDTAGSSSQGQQSSQNIFSTLGGTSQAPTHHAHGSSSSAGPAMGASSANVSQAPGTAPSASLTYADVPTGAQGGTSTPSGSSRQLAVANSTEIDARLPPGAAAPGRPPKGPPRPRRNAGRAEMSTSHPGLTEEQAQFIARLHTLNVPAEEIARVMESMRQGRAREGGNVHEEPPPMYDG